MQSIVAILTLTVLRVTSLHEGLTTVALTPSLAVYGNETEVGDAIKEKVAFCHHKCGLYFQRSACS